MKLLDWIFRKKQDWQEEYDDSWDEEVYERDSLDVHDEAERHRFIEECLSQMDEASKEIDLLTGEYHLVTTYLTDIEVIEQLPEEEMQNLQSICTGMAALTEQKNSFQSRKSKMSDTEYKNIQRREEEVEEGISKIEEAEKYRGLIKQDLKRLEAEKSAFYFRRNDLQNELINLRGMAIIILVAVFACCALLIILQFGLSFDTRLGYWLTGGVGTLVLTILYLKYSNADRELTRLHKNINRLIQVQNSVKIRYVNNTSLLEYLYVKYKVENGTQLKKLWEKYQVEKVERSKYKDTELELDFQQEELLRLLKRFKLKQPERWLNQAAAILDRREMVEIRHELIVRRQSLRKQMDYNKEVAQSAKNEIMDIATNYPEYMNEIRSLVDRYEKTY